MFDMYNSDYYKSLPENIKKQVRESGKTFETETALRQYVDGVEGIAY